MKRVPKWDYGMIIRYYKGSSMTGFKPVYLP